MELWKALILGIVQGASEYLPISSSGHLAIFREILGVDLPASQELQFDVMVHFATVLSTVVILWPMFRKLCAGFFRFNGNPDFIYVCKVLVSCIPVGIVGVFFKDYVEDIFGQGLGVVGCCLIVTALLLAFAYYSGFDRRTGRPVPADKGRTIGWGDAFIIGCAQAVAVLPGLSRSGSTIATGILLGDKRGQVATFSFIMVILPIVGESLLDLAKMISTPAAAAAEPTSAIGAGAMLTGFAAAFLVGCAACKWMIELVKRGKLIWFAVYCAAAGLLCLLW
ncbi:MAG: undecaprenyl-diphosphate phosphatase [Muribaculaceae bacterium]|nr:undecaprenyl-diphosphate phosphatase [Muribaculaceae bacterium]